MGEAAESLSDEAARDFVVNLIAVHNARMDVMDAHYDKLAQLQEYLVRLHADHDAKIDKLMDIVNALKDLQRARRN